MKTIDELMQKSVVSFRYVSVPQNTITQLLPPNDDRLAFGIYASTNIATQLQIGMVQNPATFNAGLGLASAAGRSDKLEMNIMMHGSAVKKEWFGVTSNATAPVVLVMEVLKGPD